MVSVEESLPVLNGFTSQSVLFVVNGNRYAGHYHSNGWFYCDERDCSGVRMAYGPKVAPVDRAEWLPVESWEYLRTETVERPYDRFVRKVREEQAERTAYFTVGGLASEGCVSLDMLTPLYKARYERLSEGERVLLFAVIESLASEPLGSVFEGNSIAVTPLQKTRSQITAVLKRLAEKRVLGREGDKFCILNPGFELWARCRFLQMGDYHPFLNKVCPVLLHDDKMPPKEFWMRMCEEAQIHVHNLPTYRWATKCEIA